MGAITASTVYQEDAGSLALYIITFASADTSTYTNIPLAAATVGYWANCTSAGGGDVGLVVATGVFTITNALTGPTTLYVLARQM